MSNIIQTLFPIPCKHNSYDRKIYIAVLGISSIISISSLTKINNYSHKYITKSLPAVGFATSRD